MFSLLYIYIVLHTNYVKYVGEEEPAEDGATDQIDNNSPESDDAPLKGVIYTSRCQKYQLYDFAAFSG